MVSTPVDFSLLGTLRVSVRRFFYAESYGLPHRSIHFLLPWNLIRLVYVIVIMEGAGKMGSVAFAGYKPCFAKEALE